MSLAVRRLMTALLCLVVSACGSNNEVSTNSDANGETNNANNVAADMGSTSGGADTREPAETYLGIRIVDVSEDEDECMPAEPGDPGSDIGGALVEDDLGFPVSWARVTGSDVRPDNNENVETAHIDGSVLDFQGDNCPDLAPETITTLGCGGSVVLEFVDQGGTVVPLTSGDRLRIIEHGDQCGNGDDDLYQVFFCTGSVSTGSDASCTVAYGEDLSGEAVVIIP